MISINWGLNETKRQTENKPYSVSYFFKLPIAVNQTASASVTEIKYILGIPKIMRNLSPLFERSTNLQKPIFCGRNASLPLKKLGCLRRRWRLSGMLCVFGTTWWLTAELILVKIRACFSTRGRPSKVRVQFLNAPLLHGFVIYKICVERGFGKRAKLDAVVKFHHNQKLFSTLSLHFLDKNSSAIVEGSLIAVYGCLILINCIYGGLRCRTLPP